MNVSLFKSPDTPITRYLIYKILYFWFIRVCSGILLATQRFVTTLGRNFYEWDVYHAGDDQYELKKNVFVHLKRQYIYGFEFFDSRSFIKLKFLNLCSFSLKSLWNKGLYQLGLHFVTRQIRSKLLILPLFYYIITCFRKY